MSIITTSLDSRSEEYDNEYNNEYNDEVAVYTTLCGVCGLHDGVASCVFCNALVCLDCEVPLGYDSTCVECEEGP